jgi:hypothetical protein
MNTPHTIARALINVEQQGNLFNVLVRLPGTERSLAVLSAWETERDAQDQREILADIFATMIEHGHKELTPPPPSPVEVLAAEVLARAEEGTRPRAAEQIAAAGKLRDFHHTVVCPMLASDPPVGQALHEAVSQTLQRLDPQGPNLSTTSAEAMVVFARHILQKP